jgi:membrane protease YdiL (CAAX protease family)
MLLLATGFVGLIAFIVVLILVLRLFSSSILHIPGFDRFYQYVIIIIPYLLFFAAFYYLYKKIGQSKTKGSRIAAGILLLVGCLVGGCALSLATVDFLHVKNNWIKWYNENSQVSLIIQLVIIFITAGILASGDAKEKDWMERGS